MNQNVYEPMKLSRLRKAIAKHGPLFSENETSGFYAEIVDDEQAEVIWRNAGEDESTKHREEIERLSKALNRNGYESRLMKPANTTLLVRKVEPYVVHGSAFGERKMGPFETAVENHFAGQAGSVKESLTRMPASHRRRINDEVSDIATNARRDIPLDRIDNVLRKYGYLLVQEDGTPWSGFLTGREGRTNIEIGVIGTQDENNIHEVVDNSMLVITWYKRGPRSWETVAYVS